MNIDIKPLDAQVSHDLAFLPKTSFQGMFVAGIGSGKTTMLINLLLNPNALNQRFNKIVWCSPTSHLDSKVREFLMGRNKIITPNKPLMKLIAKEQKKLNGNIIRIGNHGSHWGSKGVPPLGIGSGERDITDVQHTCEFIENTKARPLIESDFITNDPSFAFFKDILSTQDATIRKYGKPIANNVLVILDDSAAFKRAFLNESTINAVITSRHYKITTLIATQGYFLIPKTIRLNCACKVIFSIANTEEVKAIADENNCGIPKDEFITIYNKITDEDYAFVAINLLNPRGHKLSKKFEKFVSCVADV